MERRHRRHALLHLAQGRRSSARTSSATATIATATATRRWVLYNGEAEASRIPPAWHGWMHHRTDVPPTRGRLQAAPLGEAAPPEPDRHRRRLPAAGLDPEPREAAGGHRRLRAMDSGVRFQKRRWKDPGSAGRRLFPALLVAALATTAAAAPINNPVAEFTGLDKITGRTITFDVMIDETVQFGALQVTPRVCHTRPPTEPAQTTAFVEVDEITLANKIQRLFTGWMFAASPGCTRSSTPSMTCGSSTANCRWAKKPKPADAAPLARAGATDRRTLRRRISRKRAFERAPCASAPLIASHARETPPPPPAHRRASRHSRRAALRPRRTAADARSGTARRGA